jgi:hypothetical protein
MKILGYEYRVVGDRDSDYIGAFGRQNSARLLVQIASDIAPQQRISTLLHEMIEVLNYHLQLDMPHQVIMSLEAGLYHALTENGVDLSPLEALIEGAEETSA